MQRMRYNDVSNIYFDLVRLIDAFILLFYLNYVQL